MPFSLGKRNKIKRICHGNNPKAFYNKAIMIVVWVRKRFILY